MVSHARTAANITQDKDVDGDGTLRRSCLGSNILREAKHGVGGEGCQNASAKEKAADQQDNHLRLFPPLSELAWCCRVRRQYLDRWHWEFWDSLQESQSARNPGINTALLLVCCYRLLTASHWTGVDSSASPHVLNRVVQQPESSSHLRRRYTVYAKVSCSAIAGGKMTAQEDRGRQISCM